MRRSLIAGVVAIGILAGALPGTTAAADQRPELDCGDVAPTERAAMTLAVACGEDVQVESASVDDNATLFAEPDGEMRVEAAVEDPVWWRNAAARTLLSPDGSAEYGWEGTRWVGYCDPAEYAEGCATAGVQRAVWQFDGFEILNELEPEDVTSATFIVNGETAWLDDVGCTANRLEIYDVPLISAATDWASTAAWTADRHIGGTSMFWPQCEETPGYTSYFSFDATQLAVDAARDDRTSVAVGVRAADETCMTCGWNLLRQHAILRINFNRAPLAPSELQIGFLYSKVPCVDEPAFRTTMPYIGVNLVDPDGSGSTNWVEKATFSIARADEPDTPLWQDTTTEGPPSVDRESSWHQIEVPSGILEDGGRYRVTVHGTDNHGLTGPDSSCIFTVDTGRPDAPTVTPLVGGEAVYLTGMQRGGRGIPGAFLLTSASDDVVAYVFSGVGSGRVTATENTVLLVTPTAGPKELTVRALDEADNMSDAVSYEFDVSEPDFFLPTPPAITVARLTSWTVGDPAPTASVTLSADAAAPYGTVTVTSGSTVVAAANFDERTEELKLDTSALGTGTKALRFTYRAYPEAPAWSTLRTLAVRLPTISVPRSPSVSGTAQVGKTLSADPSTWAPAPTTLKYQWRVDGKAVTGAASRTWKVPASAKGKKVTVAVTGSRTGYTTRTVVSPATAAVRAGTFVVPALKITGTAKVGYTLKAVRGTWTPQPSAVKYQWKVGGVVVKGASGSSFKVPASAKGKRVAVVVTGSRAGYTTRTVSALTGVVR